MARPHRPLSGVYEHNAGSGIWYIRYRLDGKLIRKKIGTKQQAIDQLNKVRFIRASGEGVVGKSAKQLTRSKAQLQTLADTGITVAQLADGYLAHIQDENNPDRPQDQENPPAKAECNKKSLWRSPSSAHQAI